MAHQALKELLGSLDPASIERIDGEDVELKQLVPKLSAQSLFSTPTVVVSNISERKTLHDEFVQILESLDDGAELIIYEPAIDKRSKYYKYLLRNTEAHQFKQLEPNDLISWIVKETSSRGGAIDRAAARYLAERTLEDQWLISNEIDKLIAAEAIINRQLIDEMVEPSLNESIFKLIDLVLSGNQELALAQYDKLRVQKMEPIYIMSMLVWQLHIVALLVSRGKRSPEEVAKEAKISPFVAKKTAQATRNLSKGQLRRMLQLSADVDGEMKSKVIDVDEAVKQLIIKLSSF